MAIMLVFLWHYQRYGVPECLKGIALFGWTGVDLFFVLSGFLIGGQLFNLLAAGRKISITNFYMRRFFRIIPAYLVVLLLYFTLPAFSERQGIAPLWKFLTFSMNFGLNYKDAGAFSHAWSLCIEEQFYLLLPVLVILLSKLKAGHKAAIVIGALFIAGFFLRMYSWNTFVAPVMAGNENVIGNTYSTYIYYPTYNRLDGLLMGISIALIFAFRPLLKEKLLRKGNLFFAIGLLILITAYFLFDEPDSLFTAVFSYPMVDIGYGCIVLAALSPACFLNRFHFRFFSVIATLSYSVYLTHKQINHLVNLFVEQYHLNDQLVFFICIAASLAGGLLLHFIVEKPFLKLRDRLLKSPAPSGKPPA